MFSATNDRLLGGFVASVGAAGAPPPRHLALPTRSHPGPTSGKRDLRRPDSCCWTRVGCLCPHPEA